MAAGFRIVTRSSFIFETDLPPSSHNIHPSGVIHAFRYTFSGHICREEHTFAWISNSLHIESALSHLQRTGFGRSQEIVFIPYSTKRNWLDRYPHAQLALECKWDGKCVVLVNWRPYSNGLSPLGTDFRVEGVDQAGKGCSDDDSNASAANCRNDESAADANVPAIPKMAINTLSDKLPDEESDEFCSEPKPMAINTLTDKLLDEESDEFCIESKPKEEQKRMDEIEPKPKKKRIRIYKYRSPMNMLKDRSFMNDAERDEFHIEIYLYLSWLHAKLIKVEREAELASEMAESPAKAADSEEKVDDCQDEKKETPKGRLLMIKKGVDVSELQGVLDKLESSFLVIPPFKMESSRGEAEEKATSGRQQEQNAQNGKEATAEEQQSQQQRQPPPTKRQQTLRETGPFLEQALSEEWSRRVSERVAAGKPRRRSRRQKRQRYHSAPDSNRRHSRTPLEFDEMFDRLVRHKEEHGDTLATMSRGDRQVCHWVRQMRSQMSRLVKSGIEADPDVLPGETLGNKALTAERIERLNSIGFVWRVAGPKLTWQDRFEDCLDYYESNGRWPSQSMGQLGTWVQHQRKNYSKKDATYMRKWAPKLDEVGFEWTPRGNTRMTWDDGFELLMDYGAENGHYNVPCPSDKKSNEYRLYKWVQSLHAMYRSFKLGRQPGSLTDERIALLMQHGFVFRTVHVGPNDQP